MKLYYVFDAYCGWAYGFNHIFTQFMKKHPDVDLTIMSGGLFVGENKKRLIDYQRAQTINKRIENYYHMSFGEEYNRLFSDEHFTMDSLGPAQVFSILRQYVKSNQLAQLALDMQTLFFEKGLNLSYPETYKALFNTYQIPEHVMEEVSDRLHHTDELHEDFINAYKMGITSFPTLLLEKDGRLFNLIHQVQTADDLERVFQSMIQA